MAAIKAMTRHDMRICHNTTVYIYNIKSQSTGTQAQTYNLPYNVYIHFLVGHCDELWKFMYDDQIKIYMQCCSEEEQKPHIKAVTLSDSRTFNQQRQRYEKITTPVAEPATREGRHP